MRSSSESSFWSSFWLSHHFDDELGRTYRVGRVHLCARCLGTYPVLALVLLGQGLSGAPLRSGWDGVLSVGLMLPALVDWAAGRFRPQAGSNLWRTFTGVLLGVALGRSLYVHLRAPFPAWLWAQIALVCGVGGPVWLLSQRCRKSDRSSEADGR